MNDSSYSSKWRWIEPDLVGVCLVTEPNGSLKAAMDSVGQAVFGEPAKGSGI